MHHADDAIPARVVTVVTVVSVVTVVTVVTVVSVNCMVRMANSTDNYFLCSQE